MNWLQDKRLIIRVKLDGLTYVAKATVFDRIEYPGEHCMIPWLRINSVLDPHVIECPIHKLDFIEYY